MSSSTLPSALVPLGVDDRWVDAMNALDVIRLDGAPPTLARVTRTDRGACDLVTADGPVRATWGADVVAAVARDPLAVPSTGDWVASQPWPDGQRTVEAVLPRRTAVVRASVSGTSNAQVLAANVDVVAVVESLYPDPDLGRIERLMALAWESGAQPRLVLTKSDLGAAGAELALEIGAQVAAGCPVDVTVAEHADGQPAEGVGGLREVLAGGATIALLGASGVGKSTLLNALVCRFTDCAHGVEPGCAVRASVASGELAQRRLDSWHKLRWEAAWQVSRVDARVRQEQLRVWKQRTKASRQRPGCG